MQLPEDTIYLIQRDLGPVAKIAFSLACKGLYDNYFAGARHARAIAGTTMQEKREIIFLLEKDVSDRQFFCVYCRCFRNFERRCKERLGACSFETYHNMSPAGPGPASQQDSCPSLRLAINDDRGPQITFPLGRLVMNRYAFGNHGGLPLSCLEVTDLPVRALGEGEYTFVWKQTWRARIIEEELYLHCTHVLDQAQQGNLESAFLRHGLEKASKYNFCKHRQTGNTINNPALIVNGMPHNPHLTEDDYFNPHPEIGFGCSECLMDHTASITWRPHPKRDANGKICKGSSGKGSWVFRVDTYHQLGNFRRKDDFTFKVACLKNLRIQPSIRLEHGQHWRELDSIRNGSIWRRWHGPKAPQAPPGGWLKQFGPSPSVASWLSPFWDGG